jgi:hypothetical protein
MSNFFQNALTNIKGLENELLGPDYPYYKMIKTPSEIGMSDDGNAIAKNIGGLIAYSQVLVSGKSKASKTGEPLGTKFFLKTGAKCKDKKTGEKVTRSIYINSIPDGSIPFISSGLGTNFTSFRGLVPGTLSDLSRINPLEIFQSFMLGTEPECQAINMPTVNNNNVTSNETAYVLTNDIKNMSACWFPNKKNPITNEQCREAFSLIQPKKNDFLTHAYLSSISLLCLYIFLKIWLRKK